MGTNEEVIKRITEIRKKNGLSINKLADKCGVNSANLSRSLAGKASLTDRVIYKIASALHVSVDWLEKGIEPMFSPTVASTADVGAGITGSNVNGSNSSNVSQSIGSDAALAAENKLLREQNEFLQSQVKTLLAIVGQK
jgi:transcriptional regulator with XRE-family HTH domain